TLFVGSVVNNHPCATSQLPTNHLPQSVAHCRRDVTDEDSCAQFQHPACQLATHTGRRVFQNHHDQVGSPPSGSFDQLTPPATDPLSGSHRSPGGSAGASKSPASPIAGSSTVIVCSISGTIRC